MNLQVWALNRVPLIDPVQIRPTPQKTLKEVREHTEGPTPTYSDAKDVGLRVVCVWGFRAFGV